MQFCPTCGNSLLIENTGNQSATSFRFFCVTCPYTHNITKKIIKRVTLKRKEVDDVLGGAEAWENVDQTEATCPKCNNRKAFFMQIQTRSADEPMTTFYKCCNFDCQHQWKEN